MNLGGTIHLTKTGCCILLGSVIILIIYLLPSKDRELTQTSAEKINLNLLLTVAIQAAENGGKEVVTLLNDIQISSKGKTKEGANDSVTTADFQSHCVIISSIKQHFPRLNVISEEQVICSDKIKHNSINLTLASVNDQYVDEKDVRVWIDPLDATQEYTEKLTQYVTTMICVAVKGKPIIGVIHKPFSKSTFWAWIEKGHSTNLIPKMSQGNDKLKFIVSRSHMGEVRTKINSLFKDNVDEIITAGGAGYKVLEVINGNADIYFHVTAIKKWDVCAGNAILNAVGGQMTTLHGQEIYYGDSTVVRNEDGIIATLLPSLNIDFN